MIRREEKKGWFLINQHDHALLSSQIMNYWGNEAFDPPDPHDEVLFAIAEHDNGWREWDSAPKVNTETRYPMNFMEMNFADQETIWTRSFRRFSESHTYASALIALHFRVFNQKILEKKEGNSRARRLNLEINSFVAGSLNLESSNSGLPNIPKKAKINLRLLQVGDIISLALCHGWQTIDIDAVPINYEGRTMTLKLISQDSINYLINPYPFSRDALRFRITGRRLNQKGFETDRELQRIFKQCDIEALELSINRQ